MLFCIFFLIYFQFQSILLIAISLGNFLVFLLGYPLNTINTISIEAGNRDSCLTLPALHKLVSESRAAEYLTKDSLFEVKLFQEVYFELDREKHIPGFIQYFAQNPFMLHLYSRDQLLLYLSTHGDRNLFFDATGSIIKRITGQNKPIYLYGLVMENPVKKRAAIPLAEMVSNDHHASEVSHFFKKLFDNIKLIRQQNIVPRKIEIDFSWDMIHGIVNGINNESITSYLRRCWSIINCNEPKEAIKQFTYVHICSAHYMHIMAVNLARMKVTKDVKEFAMHTIALLVDSTSLQNATKTFRDMCYAFCVRSKNTKCSKSVKNLQKSMKGEIKASKRIGMEVESERDKCNQKSIKQNSPFYRHFFDKWMKIHSGSESSPSNEINEFYCPQVMEMI